MEIAKKQANWEELFFYQKAKALYAITYYFAHAYLKPGDRTIDQMVQAARSGKQNIIEGAADGVTSMEMEIKLLNVARGSLKELREDYEDYLMTRRLCLWNERHPGYDRMLAFCREHDKVDEYTPLLRKLSDEKIANMSITLCHLVDRMMISYHRRLAKDFTENGGIRERMAAARLGYRNNQKQLMQQLLQENALLKKRVAELEDKLAVLNRAANE